MTTSATWFLTLDEPVRRHPDGWRWGPTWRRDTHQLVWLFTQPSTPEPQGSLLDSPPPHSLHPLKSAYLLSLESANLSPSMPTSFLTCFIPTDHSIPTVIKMQLQEIHPDKIFLAGIVPSGTRVSVGWRVPEYQDREGDSDVMSIKWRHGFKKGRK